MLQLSIPEVDYHLILQLCARTCDLTSERYSVDDLQRRCKRLTAVVGLMLVRFLGYGRVVTGGEASLNTGALSSQKVGGQEAWSDQCRS